MYKNLKNKIIQNISDTLSTLGVSKYTVDIPHPDVEFGDFVVNSAMVYAKELSKNPREIAEIISKNLNKIEEILKIDIAGPGFINITLKESVIRDEIERVSTLECFDTNFTGKKVLVEHSSPNLFKPFHIGHLMNNTVGESVVRLMRAGGADVKTTSFPSDISLGIAKTVYFIKKDLEKKGLHVPYFGETLEEEIKYLGDSYVKGITYYEEHPEEQEKIKKLVGELVEEGINDNDGSIYKEARKINIKYFESIVGSLGSKFDSYIYESTAGFIGRNIITSIVDKSSKPFIKSEGAIVYIPHEDRKDINTTVFINSQGNPTYAGKDIGLIDLKFTLFNNPDFSIYITDNEQIPHFKTVFAAAEEIDDVWRDRISKSRHVPHGRMTFKGAKMSSRLGGVPLAEDTINTVIEEVKERSGTRLEKYPEIEKEKIYKDIALASIKFAILRAKPGQNINFDPEVSLSFEGDSGPYVQYTHARASSILKKSNIVKIQRNDKSTVTVLEKKIMRFENVATQAINDFAPQQIVSYLFDLAQEFNSYYASNQIVVEGDIGTAHRLWIVSQTKNTIKKALGMLAVQAPNEM